jgi:hypothetical protein
MPERRFPPPWSVDDPDIAVNIAKLPDLLGKPAET